MGPVSYCETRNFPVANATDLFHAVSLGSAVITAITFPLTVLGNALVLLAIWRNRSMRSPSFFLLGMLSFEYFLCGLIIQPFYAAKELGVVLKSQKQEVVVPSSDRSAAALYVNLIAGGFGTILMAITISTVTLMALERWMHMTQRRWGNLSRIYKLFVALLSLPILLGVFRSLELITPGSFCTAVNTLVICQFSFCFTTTTITYIKVLFKIRRHKRQIQANFSSQNAPRFSCVNVAKYKKSVLTIFYHLTLFYLCYFPFVVSVILSLSFEDSLGLRAAVKISLMLLFVSSMLNPCLNCWRIREIRNGARMALKKLICRGENEPQPRTWSELIRKWKWPSKG